MSVLSAPDEVTRALALARDPATADQATWQAATEQSLGWLLEIPPATAESIVHWYCAQKSDGLDAAWGAACFSVRLFGYKTQGQIAEWRERHFQLMSTCPNCVRAFQRAKAEFTQTCVVDLLKLSSPPVES